MMIEADWYADWCWLIVIDAGWCWLILIDAGWFWFMLIDAYWCWLMSIYAQIRFNWVFFCRGVPPELLRSFLRLKSRWKCFCAEVDDDEEKNTLIVVMLFWKLWKDLIKTRRCRCHHHLLVFVILVMKTILRVSEWWVVMRWSVMDSIWWMD